ncbi:hypothetical protein SAY86_018543 [Trapa natans]|uniref:TRF2/HOY1 PH-like domain-containing protein n=1 Tax=Trapa natans TaxID=22666 RepID=A0AAN7R0Z7_TRANT|nr:hypothetical protein SAY86_018543 [Trapa natans]
MDMQTCQQKGAGANAFPIPPSQYNPLDEPSPLGLRLKKSPSFLDLIQMRLSQGTHALEGIKSEDHGKGVKKDSQTTIACNVTAEKMKASNFPASVLKIGEWKYESRYEGDLVAKCYFAKRKLVWEILEGGLKSKIEIQWADIVGLKAVFPDNGSGELNVVLGKQPLFFRETNPQPRKHTLWQATSDFTDSQASMHRQHVLECSSDLLKKNFEKLIQCDVHLNLLSQKGDIFVGTPLFEAKPLAFGDLEQSKSFSMTGRSNESVICMVKESNLAQLSSSTAELSDCVSAAPKSSFEDISSPSSDAGAIEVGMKMEAVNARMTTHEQVNIPGLRKSMSLTDFMNHIGQSIAENVESGMYKPADGLHVQETFEDIAKHLLSDNQMTTVSDEKLLMSRVNSLCCLLQIDPQGKVQGLQAGDEADTSGVTDGAGKETVPGDTSDSTAESQGITREVKVTEGDQKDVSSSCKQQLGMLRKDSFADLLLQLPRVASLPKFLFDISEENA